MYRDRLQLNKKNVLAALYPTAKLWIVLLYCLSTLILSSIKVDGYPFYLIGFYLCIPILFLASGIGIKAIKLFIPVFWLGGAILFVQTFVIPGEVVLYQYKFIRIYKYGMQHGLFLCFLILNFAGIILWLFQTTEHRELSRAMEKSGMSDKAAFVFLSTLQMIEILGSKSKVIMNAQRARGVETEGNIIVRFKAFVPALIPLVLGAITNTEERVLTLECRGFDVVGKKTRLFDISRTGKEPLALAFAGIIFAALLVWRIMLWVL